MSDQNAAVALLKRDLNAGEQVEFVPEPDWNGNLTSGCDSH